MSVSRRKFLQHSSAALAATALPFHRARAAAQLDIRQQSADVFEDEDTIRTFVTTALDAARAAGAVYADARYIVMEGELHDWRPTAWVAPFGYVHVGMGVRALYNGYWGYAALEGQNISPESVARLGREATAQAKVGAKGPPREVVLAPAPVVNNGRWATPIEIDPFTVSWEEKRDVVNGLMSYIGQQSLEASGSPQSMSFQKVQTTFGSTDGSFYTKTVYRSGLRWSVGMQAHWRTNKFGRRGSAGIIDNACAGWEYILNAPIESACEQLIKQANDTRFGVPIDIGRYDMVFDGVALGAIANETLGIATELDRAMGYLANAEGTSYINDPLGMLGALQIGSSHLTVVANRTMPRGLATVKWDDEGVEPDDAVLVKNGVLTDFQTTRESATWLRPYYEKTGKPFRSHGGAIAEQIGGSAVQAAHNLVVTPSSSDTSFESLCSQVDNGFAVFGGFVSTDQQALNGTVENSLMYEIKKGKLGRVVEGGVLLIRSPEFWKNLEMIGGKSTVCTTSQFSVRDSSGGQMRDNTVSAPAGLIKQVAVSTNVPRILPNVPRGLR